LPPGNDMKVITVDEGPVDVEDRGGTVHWLAARPA
jgi:hypothetical protein